MATTNEIIPEDLITIASTTTIIEINQLNTTIPLESIFIDSIIKIEKYCVFFLKSIIYFFYLIKE